MSGQDEQRERIVVGVDGSPAADAALAWALDEARRRAARLEVVAAWRPSAAIGPPAGHPGASSRSPAERRADAEELIALALKPLSSEGVEIERRAMRGSAHRVLADAASDATLLVIGGAGGLAGKLPWSTGSQLVHEASCPVVVVPAGTGSPEAPSERPSHPEGARAGLASGGQLPA